MFITKKGLGLGMAGECSILCCMSIFLHLSSTSERLQTYNLLMIKERSKVNLEAYWNYNKSDNGSDEKDKTTSISTLIPGGNFRSSVIDTWDVKPPHEIGLMFFNNIGDLQFYMFFNTMNVSRDIKQWMIPDRLIGSISFGMREHSTSTSWHVPGYTYLFKSKQTNKAWFAISDRNLKTGENDYPFFNVPSTHNPFVVVDANDTSGIPTIKLLQTWGPYHNQTKIKVQAGSMKPIFVSKIRVTTRSSHDANSSQYQLHYSQQHCGSSEQTVYRNINGDAKDLEADVTIELEQLYLTCMYVTFKQEMDDVHISLYGPSDTDFMTLPIVVLRGIWYWNPDSDLSTKSSNTSETTTRHTTSSMETTPQENNCTCDLTTKSSNTSETTTRHTTSSMETTSQENNCTCECTLERQITEIELEHKIQTIKDKLRVNKTHLSSHKRRYISVEDSRLSAKGIGIVAGLFLGIAFILVLILDLSTLQHELGVLKVLIRK